MIIWLVVAILAAIGEVLTLGLFLATISAAAVITALVSFSVHSIPLQIVIFAVLCLAGLGIIRPVLVRVLGIESVSHPTGPVVQSHIVGRKAIVTRAVDDLGGQIRIGEGEFWTARAYQAGESMSVGTPVEIMLVDGLSALVAPLPRALSPEPELQPLQEIPHDKGA